MGCILYYRVLGENRMLRKIIDKIDEFIEYDNEHHCFRPFVLGFCTATIIAQIVVLICLIIKKF